MLRNACLWLTALCLTVLVLEGLSLAYVSVQLRVSPGRVSEEVDRLASASVGADRSLAVETQKTAVGHPYYGFVANTNNDAKQATDRVSAENLGFHGDAALLKEYYDDVCNVAILGGSVANIFYAAEKSALHEYFAGLAQNKGKKVNIFGLTNWAYKQPQQLLVLLDLIAQGVHFDYVVNIDGFNEVAESLGDNVPNNVYPFFPYRWDVMARDFSGGHYGRNKELLKIVDAAYHECAVAYMAFRFKPYVVRALFVAGRSLHAMLKANLQQAMKVETFGVNTGNNLVLDDAGSQVVNSAKPVAPDILPWLVLHWARSSALLHNAVVAQGGRYYHILQPNQYVSESKPFTENELKQYVNTSMPLASLVPAYYPLLSHAGNSLRREGVAFLDFSRLFSTVHEELYVDDCCHFNKKGNDLMARSLTAAIDDDQGKPVSTVGAANINAVASHVLADDRLRSAYYSRYALRFDLFEDKRDWTITNILPVENAARRERWAIKGEHSLGFYSPESAPITLDAVFLTTLAGQGITVLWNAQVVKVMPDLTIAGGPFDYASQNTLRLDLKTRSGWNVLSIVCARHNTQDRDFSILYTHFSLVKNTAQH